MQKLIKSVVYLFIMLIPVLIVPSTVELWQFNKVYLLFAFNLVMLVLLVIDSLYIKKRLLFKNSFFDIPLLIIIPLSLISSLLSLDRSVSFLGMYGRFNDSFLVLSSCILLYFYISNVLTAKDISKVITAYLGSSIFSVTIFLLLIIPFTQGIIIKVLNILKLQNIALGFNLTSASPQAFAMYLSILSILALGLILISTQFKSINRIIAIMFLVVSLSSIYLIGFNPAIIVLIVGVALLFVLYILKFGKNMESVKGSTSNLYAAKIGIVLFVLGLSSAALIFKPYNLQNREVILDTKESNAIAASTLKSSPLFGSGSGTIMFDVAKYHSLDYNKGSLWSIRFDVLSNYFLSLATSNGILITLILAGVILSMIVLGIVIGSYTALKADPIVIVLMSSLAGTLVGMAFYTYDISLLVALFLIMGLAVSYFHEKGVLKFKTIDIDLNKTSSVYTSLISLGGLGVFMIIFIAGVYGARFYQGDVMYKKALASTSEEEFSKNIAQAHNINPYVYAYDQTAVLYNLSGFKTAIDRESAKTTPDVSSIQKYITAGTDILSQLEKKHPNDPRVFELKGIFFGEINKYFAVDSNMIKSSIERALKLEPNNPTYYSMLTQMYTKEALKDTERKEVFKANISLAQAQAQKSIDLKQNYSQGYIDLAELYELQSEPIKASETLNAYLDFTKQNNEIADVNAVFTLGRVYFNNKQLDKAKEVFTVILQTFPDHSNSLYSLGLIAEIEKDIPLAKSYFEKVLTLNPEATEVKEKIKTVGTSASNTSTATNPTVPVKKK